MKILLTIILLFLLNHSFACTCPIRGELNVRDYYDPHVILLGTVVKVEKNSSIPELEYNTKEILIDIKEFFKGQLHNVKQIKIYTSFSDASCGLAVNNTGEDWIIFAYNNEHGFLITDMCTHSKAIQNRNDEYISKLKSYSEATGVTKFYNSKQTLYAQGEMINQQPHGFWSYYADTWLHQTGYYNHGVKDSTWVLYNPKGKIDRIENYQNGDRHGAFIQYNWQNGYPSVIRYYQNNKCNGKTFIFYEDGKLMITGQFKDNKPIGEWIAYDSLREAVCKSIDKSISRRQDNGVFSRESDNDQK